MKKFDYDTMQAKIEVFIEKPWTPMMSITGYDLVKKYNAVEVDLSAKTALGEVNFEEVRDWCETQFGNNWLYKWDVYYFKHKQDATLFALKWS